MRDSSAPSSPPTDDANCSPFQQAGIDPSSDGTRRCNSRRHRHTDTIDRGRSCGEIGRLRECIAIAAAHLESQSTIVGSSILAARKPLD